MAKDKKEIKGFSYRGYILAGIMLAVISFVSILLITQSVQGVNKVYENTLKSNKCVNNINNQLSAVNRNVLMIISSIGDTDSLIEDISNSFDVIDKNRAEYEKIEGHSDLELRRYNMAIVFIDAYHEKMINYQQIVTDLDETTARNAYIQEIHPLQVTASEMFSAAIDVGSRNSEKKIAEVERNYRLFLLIMVVLFVGGEAAIFFVAKVAKKAAIIVAHKEEELAKIDKMLKSSRMNGADMIGTNGLTNLKNRYALETDLRERLNSDKFFVAIFDMDNFRSINDVHGYDFGDEYLVKIADKLKSEFSEYAEIYNITANNFCFIFNREISDDQANNISQSIQKSLSGNFTVLNLVVQLTASGCVHEYHPGDCSTVNSLLMKLDKEIRSIKSNGGNAITKL